MKKIYEKIVLALLPLCGYAANSADPIPVGSWPFNEYENRIVIFPPWHLVYERIKPNDFYIGIEGWITGAVRSVPTFYNSHEHQFSDDKTRFIFIAEAEFRLGYNYFYNGRDHFTPILGGGVFKDTSKYWIHTWGWDYYRGSYSYDSPDYHLPWLGYGTVGFLYNHEFNSIFNLGANLKGILGGGISSEYMKWGSVVLGFDIAFPFTFRFGHKRHWDIRLEPFNIYLHGSHNSRNYVGGRSTIAYRF